MRLPLAATLLVALGLAVGGCGDSGSAADSDGDGDAQISRAEYVERANAACRRENAGLEEAMAAYLEEHRGDGDPAPVLYANAVQRVLLPAVEAQIWRVERLPEPVEEEMEIRTMFAHQRISVDVLAVRSHITSIEAAEKRFARPAKQMRAFGLDDCVIGRF